MYIFHQRESKKKRNREREEGEEEGKVSKESSEEQHFNILLHTLIIESPPPPPLPPFTLLEWDKNSLNSLVGWVDGESITLVLRRTVNVHVLTLKSRTIL